MGTLCPATPEPVVPPLLLPLLPQPAAMTDATVSASAADMGRAMRRRCIGITGYPPQSANPDRAGAEL